jgi:hypothetical protein
MIICSVTIKGDIYGSLAPMTFGEITWREESISAVARQVSEITDLGSLKES